MLIVLPLLLTIKSLARTDKVKHPPASATISPRFAIKRADNPYVCMRDELEKFLMHVK